MPDRDLDLLAASLRANAADTQALVEVLAAKLENALPHQTIVARRRTRLFAKAKRTHRISLQLGDETYTLTVQANQAHGHRAITIGRTIVKSQDLTLDAWISAVSQRLTAEAARSEAARQALQRLLD